jgi:hypothetical protein
MKNQSVKNLISSVSVLVLSAIISLGYSQKKPADALPGGSLKLEYKYPEGKTYKYVSESKIVQDMDVNGQSMLVNIAVYLGCEVKAAGKQGDNLNLEIKIDSMAQNIESPQGTAGGTIGDVKEKVFSMVISPAGKIVDLSGATKIVYNIEGSGESNLEQGFLNFFPALPKGPVKTGDTWVANDTIQTNSERMSLTMPVQSEFKFEGTEKVDGIDCAKISATISGTRKMSTEAQGMKILTNGPFTGTQTLFFAINEGYFVKQTEVTKMTGTIDIPDQSMSFPVVMNITSTNQIVK